MHGVKDQENLTDAFIRLCDRLPEHAARLRLVMIGDGPLREVCQGLLKAAGRAGQAWLPGDRDDIADLMRSMSIFVLPSQAEGISNTILEAMATGLPVVATAVGGNPELVVDGETGRLVPSGDPDGMAAAIADYVTDGRLRERQGAAARQRAERQFSLDDMMELTPTCIPTSSGKRRRSCWRRSGRPECAASSAFCIWPRRRCRIATCSSA